MRQLASRVLGKYPQLKRNRAYYEVQLLRDAVQAKPDPAATPHADVVEALVRDGVVVIPGWASAEQVAAARDGLQPWFEKLRAGDIEEAWKVPPEEHFYFRVPKANERVAETSFFYDSPFIREIAHAYLSPKAEPYRFEAEWRYERRNRVSAEDIFHFDSWRPMFKAFLYLVDVTEENGPFVYLKGSHARAAWRRKRALEFDADGEAGSFGHFFPTEIQHLKREHGFEEAIVTGQAGTLILGDFRGLHRGSPMLSGERKMLNIVFGIQDWSF